MQSITVEELINYKILPFNIYTEGDKLLFSVGEVLTPGKFLQLRHIAVIYRKVEEEVPLKNKENCEMLASSVCETSYIDNQLKDSNNIDDVEFKNIVTQINKQSPLNPEIQTKLKIFYNKTVGDLSKIESENILPRMKNMRDKLLDDYFDAFDKAVYFSQLRLVGDYDTCHSINVALLAIALSKKLGKSEDFISDIILAALLHDIGKICLPQNIVNKSGVTLQEQKLYQAHTKIGYNLIKNKLGLSDKIARVALEHHEHNDGTGFPSGKSGNFISLESQIISVCNYFDNLMFNKTPIKIYNAKEALKIMLEMGSKNFAIDVLYTFIYMYNYDDTKPLEEI